MDQINLRLLQLLEEDARLPIVELGRKVGLSAAAVSDRLKKLEDEGVIAAYRTLLNPLKLGYSARGFLRLETERSKMTQLIALARSTPEIKELHQTGSGRFVARLLARDAADLERVAGAFAEFGTVHLDPIVATPVEKYTT